MPFIDADKHPSDINDRLLIDQYNYYFEYYTKIYKQCTVIYQNGKFYEFYGVDRPDCKIGHVKEMAKITLLNMNYLYPEKKTTINTKENPMRIGFLTNTRSKYVSFLVDKGWTVVQIDQQDTRTDEKEKFRRGVTVIHSPDTYIDEETVEVDNRFIVSIIVEAYTDPEFDPVVIGLSAIDITTGQTVIYETSNSKDDQNFAFDEITRFVSAHSPKEVLYHGSCEVNNLTVQGNERKRNYPSGANGLTNNYVYNKKHEDPKYQTKFLEKVFGTTLFSSISETLGISRYTVAVTSFISLLQYCLDHNPVLLESLTPPIIFSNNNNLVLSNNTIEQLNLITNNSFKFSNIFNLVNFTSTPMGYRLLKNRLVNPITNIEELNRRYDLITTYWDKYEPIQEILKTICDLEKAIRKISEKNIKNIVYAIYQIAKLCRLVDEGLEVPRFSKVLTWLNDNVDCETETLFKSERLQSLQDTKHRCLSYFSKCKKSFEEAVNGSVEMLLNEEGCRFKFSNAKYKKVEKDLVILSSNKTYKYCTTKKLQAVSEEYSTACEEYDEEFTSINKSFCTTIKGFQKQIMAAIHFTAQIDVVVSSIICAQKFRYCKPKVMEGKSFISSKQIRHPIIEQINNSIYTPHDIDFGVDTNAQTGMLLYGFNASGKSSLMKAIGVNLVMAQAGLFVAAKKFRYSPYTNIQTRILSNDDLQKGMSSFAVEMSELRGILSRANDSSLILGDEISRGTESISGVAIVAAAILELVKKESHFLFATHLHQLAELKEIKKLSSNSPSLSAQVCRQDDPSRFAQLGIFHLSVERDLKTGVLVYKRDLQPGCGDSLYGLEVARAMKLPQEFLDRAMIIRKEILNEREFIGKSCVYNAEMFLTTCGVCQEEAVEVHHIRPQKEADSDGYIDHFHKNKLRNMVGLCTACHKKVTFGKIIIKKWVETSEGMVLKWR